MLLRSARIRWYAVYRILTRLLLIAVLIVVVLTPRFPVPETRELQRAMLRTAWGAAAAALGAGVVLTLREPRRSIRRQYALSTAGCAAALAVAVIGYPARQAPPPSGRAATLTAPLRPGPQ